MSTMAKLLSLVCVCVCGVAALSACGSDDPPDVSGPVIDDVTDVAWVTETEQSAAGPTSRNVVKAKVSYHDPEGDAVKAFSFVLSGSGEHFQPGFPTAPQGTAVEVELAVGIDITPPGVHDFDLTLQDERGVPGPTRKVSVTVP
jgi:hypothetical protein